MKNMIIAGAMMAMSMTAQARVLAGVDQDGNSCQLVLNDVQVSAPVAHNPCDFDSDGEGPWCTGKPAINVVHVTGGGEYVTTAGRVNFSIDDEYAFLDEQGQLTSVTADPAGGGTVSIDLTKSANANGSVYFYFPTAYGKTLTGKQIVQALDDRSSGRSYSEIWKSIYTDVTCTLK
ncbi:hypothetical protein [Bdellovibrio sp. NC01]|uniref:hypothetical protein n=1 Tax=Bdellovibrio sp. NC01 TaxID=2220073 RepID=UPI0011590048|nr:hypothetical protein [Bdellovibrio sp. NC01]QDK38178.1 hypothetical protein DOE51_11585 [Bdellovibrio sp. NC01]